VKVFLFSKRSLNSRFTSTLDFSPNILPFLPTLKPEKKNNNEGLFRPPCVRSSNSRQRQFPVSICRSPNTNLRRSWLESISFILFMLTCLHRSPAYHQQPLAQAAPKPTSTVNAAAHNPPSSIAPPWTALLMLAAP